MLSPMIETRSNLSRILQISSVVYHLISQPRGEKGASMPILPPLVMAVSRLSLSEQSGENGSCKSSEEKVQFVD